MGQGGSTSESKSIILSNWVEIQPNSNIFFNNVTNQQIERHQVVINEKQELSSYIKRMHDQSGFICRLIYFHLKPTSKDTQLKKIHSKQSSSDIQSDYRAKSHRLEEFSNKTKQGSLIKNPVFGGQHELESKAYCIYTDRMIPVKQWKKDKIIDIIAGLKKLTKIYGYFKIRENCICENERKQIKVWINQNPANNFPMETVQSEEDMIADLAALLVSRKQKIVKQLLDMQYFDDVIASLAKLNDRDVKKLTQKSHSTTRSTGFSVVLHRQSQQGPSVIHHAPEVNNFYNVFINTENGYTVNANLPNSKQIMLNKGLYRHPCSNNQFSQTSKELQTDELSQKQDLITETDNNQNEANVKHGHRLSTHGSTNRDQYFSQSSFGLIVKKKQLKQQIKNPTIMNSNQSLQINHESHLVIRTSEQKKKTQQRSNPDTQYNSMTDEKQFMENTSIMLQNSNINSDFKKPLKTEKDKHIFTKDQKLTLTTSQKYSSWYELNQLKTHNSKSNAASKFIGASHQLIKNTPKNNSSADLKDKTKFKTQQQFLKQNQTATKPTTNHSNLTVNLNNNTLIGENPCATMRNYFISQTSKGNSKIGTTTFKTFKNKSNELKKNNGQKNKTEECIIGYECKNSIKNQQSLSAKSQNRVFAKSIFNERNQIISNNEHHISVVQQANTIKPVIILNTATIQQSQNTLNKKSFPKYFSQKNPSKNIQKYFSRPEQQRENSKAMIGKQKDQLILQKLQTFSFHSQHQKDESIVTNKLNDNQAFSHQIISKLNPQFIPTDLNDNYLKEPVENFEQRRRFTSANSINPKKLIDIKQIKEQQFHVDKQENLIDFQQNFMIIQDGVKSIYLSPPLKTKQKSLNYDKNKTFNKTSKNDSFTNPYFNQDKSNNSLMTSHNFYSKNIYETDKKSRKSKDSMDQISTFQNQQKKDLETKNIFQNSFNNQIPSKLNLKLFCCNEEPKERDSVKESQNQLKTQYFCNFKPNSYHSNIKDFKFYEEMSPKAKVYCKVQSFKSADEKETLPSTTTDQGQKKTYKPVRVSDNLLDANQLHSSDPGQKILQIVQKIEKQKQVFLQQNSHLTAVIRQKLDVKQYPKFQKWEPSLNVYGSLINHQGNGSCFKKKESSKSQKQPTISDEKASQQDSQKKSNQKLPHAFVYSQNLQTKKTRQEVIMDYKGLFGDENPIQQWAPVEQKEKIKKIKVKKRRDEQEHNLQSASSKDLLIQEKVQKQKQKHAQIKNDLSKLFNDQI